MPAEPGGRAYITSDHYVYCHHYYVDEDFELFYAYRLWIFEDPFRFQANPRNSTDLDEFDPVEDIMPIPFEDSDTITVDVTDLPSPKKGKIYHMSAYTRLDAYYGPMKIKNSHGRHAKTSLDLFTNLPKKNKIMVS